MEVVALKQVRAAIVVFLIAGLVASGVVGYRLFTEDPDREPPISRATGSTDDGWQLVSYRGVTVEVPPDWDRLATTSCASSTEHWAPAGRDPCAYDVGLWFLSSATFDAATGPGVRVEPASDALPLGGWSGYVTRGDVVVDVSGDDELVVRRILQSVSQII